MSSGPFIGFVLLTHEKPDQILRLIDRLNFMFDNPPIACHHDFSQCSLPLEKIPDNIHFVKPHLKTAWAGWSITEATVKALKLLFSRPDSPQWFTLLSGTDYPLKKAEEIISYFKNSEFDAHINSTKLVKGELKNQLEEIAYTRYHTLIFKYPSIAHFLLSVKKRRWVKEEIYIKKPKYTRWFTSYRDDFHCYMGHQWFSANRKAAQYILEFDSTHRRVRNHYKKVHCADESYFQTILYNSNTFNLSTENRRYVQWVPNYAHPKQLSMENFLNLMESGDHFARKFNLEENPEIFDRLDEVIGYRKDENQEG